MSGGLEGAKAYGEAGMDALAMDIQNAVAPFRANAENSRDEGGVRDPAKPPRPPNAARKVQEVAGAVSGVLGLPMELANTGFALLTAPLAALWRSPGQRD